MASNQEFTPKNNPEWFLFNLFTDPEFLAAKESIHAKLKKFMGDESYGLLYLIMPGKSISEYLKQLSKRKTARLIHLMEPNKPELQFDPDSPAVEIIQDIEALAAYFQASIATVELGLKYNEAYPRTAFKQLPSVTIEDDKVVIRMDGTMKLADIRKVYPYIMELQKELSNYRQRNRSKERPDLIYAIYKQRLKGVTFKQIYALYTEGKLPGYMGVASIVGEDSLETAYNKYKPTI